MPIRVNRIDNTAKIISGIGVERTIFTKDVMKNTTARNPQIKGAGDLDSDVKTASSRKIRLHNRNTIAPNGFFSLPFSF